MTPAKRREILVKFLNAKLGSGDQQIQSEGAHAIWELSSNKDYHREIVKETVLCILQCIESNNLEVAMSV